MANAVFALTRGAMALFASFAVEAWGVTRIIAAISNAISSFTVCLCCIFNSPFLCQRVVDRSLHRQRNALAVAVEFRRIHALDFGDTGLIFAAQLDAG